MQQYIGVILLISICSFIPSIVWILCLKEEPNFGIKIRKYIPKTFFFFVFINSFLMSAMKFILGYQKESLFESFWNIQWRTYFHYGLVLIIIGLIFPFVFHLIFKGNEWKIIKYFDSIMFLSLFFSCFCVRKLNNRVYCTAFIIAFLITLISLIYILKHDITSVNATSKKTFIHNYLPFILYWIVTIVIYAPNELYLHNATDFPVSYWYFFGKIMIGSIILLIIAMLGSWLLLLEPHASLLSTTLFALLTIGYLQNMILNGSMQQLDGSTQEWSVQQKIVNLLIWLILFIAICLFRFLKKQIAMKFMHLISTYLILIQVVSLAILSLSSPNTSSKTESALTRDGLVEIGKNNNIIVFVLDKFDGEIIDRISTDYPNFFEPLQDFTYYRNATSKYMFTSIAIPYLLTGTEWEGSESIETWTAEKAYTGDTLLNSLKNMNYSIDLFTETIYVPEAVKDSVNNYTDGIKRECQMTDLLSLMTQCSRYKMAPFIAKNYYQYDTYDIVSLSANDNVYNPLNDLPFYSELTSQRLSVEESQETQGSFKFIHMWGAHPPYTMTEEFQYIDYDSRRDIHIGNQISQSKGALKIIYEYIEQLKQLDKYDDSTIIITADHGYIDWPCDNDGNVDKTSIPILFIKEPHDQQEQMLISETPVCHDDVIATIYKQIGIDTNGTPCSEIPENSDRIREYIHYDYVNGVFSKFEVSGNVRDLESWKHISSFNVGK